MGFLRGVPRGTDVRASPSIVRALSANSLDGCMSIGASEAETTVGSGSILTSEGQFPQSPMPSPTPSMPTRTVVPRTPDLFANSRTLLSDVSPGSVVIGPAPPGRLAGPCQESRPCPAPPPPPPQSLADRFASTRSSLGGRSRVQRYVVRVGLRLQCRISGLLEVADRLEHAGFSVREHFQTLTDDVARELRVPKLLADALRADAFEGRKRPGREEAPPRRQEQSACQREASPEGVCASQTPRAIPMYDSNVGAAREMCPLGGFPFALRDYEPKCPATPRCSLSPLRRPVSESEEPAFQQHLSRVLSARELRHHAQDMRISNIRRETPPPPCRGEQILNHRSSAPVLGTSRNRCMAGAAVWTRMKESTKDISPTYIPGPTAPEYQRDYGWGSEISSPRMHHRCVSGSPLFTEALHSSQSARAFSGMPPPVRRGYA